MPSQVLETVYRSEDAHQDAQSSYLLASEQESQEFQQWKRDKKHRKRSKSRRSSRSSRSRSRSRSPSGSRSRSSSSDSSSHTPRGSDYRHSSNVLKPISQAHREDRRLDNMAPRTTNNSKSGRGKPTLPKKKTGKSNAEDDKKEATIKQLKLKLAAAQAKNQDLQANGAGKKRNKGKSALVASGNIPYGKSNEVSVVAKEELYRECKFIMSQEEIEGACKIVMGMMEEFQDLLAEDPDECEANIQAFADMYGSDVTKAINNRRTDSQGALKKKFDDRCAKELPIPTPHQLMRVVYRKPDVSGLLPLPKFTEEQPGKDASQEEKDAYQAKLTEFQAKLDDVQAKNKDLEQDVDWFCWYWECLLPCLVGSKRWGQSIRRFCTITKGSYANDTEKKFITSSDEAITLLMYENCYGRWQYLQECKKKKVTYDRCATEYQTLWVDLAAGQNQFGGWEATGVSRYYTHQKKIAAAKKKERSTALESLALKRVKGMADEDEEDEDPKMSGKQAKVNGSFLAFDSDAEDLDDEDSDLEELDMQRRAPPRKKTKRVSK